MLDLRIPTPGHSFIHCQLRGCFFLLFLLSPALNGFEKEHSFSSLDQCIPEAGVLLEELPLRWCDELEVSTACHSRGLRSPGHPVLSYRLDILTRRRLKYHTGQGGINALSCTLSQDRSIMQLSEEWLSACESDQRFIPMNMACGRPCSPKRQECLTLRFLI